MVVDAQSLSIEINLIVAGNSCRSTCIPEEAISPSKAMSVILSRARLPIQ